MPFQTRLVSALVASAALVAILLATRFASGELADVDSPTVAFSANYPERARQQVLAALQTDGAKFIRGSSLNSFTQLHFSGDTKALSGFLEKLATCPGVTISVSFYRPDRDSAWAPEGSQWSVFHSAGVNQFDVRINMRSARIELDRLHIPRIKRT